MRKMKTKDETKKLTEITGAKKNQRRQNFKGKFTLMGKIVKHDNKITKS